ncbi:MAG: ABC transporter ATP-binding protein, partial [Deltaproteobacteria bacterium]
MHDTPSPTTDPTPTPAEAVAGSTIPRRAAVEALTTALARLAAHVDVALDPKACHESIEEALGHGPVEHGSLGDALVRAGAHVGLVVTATPCTVRDVLDGAVSLPCVSFVEGTDGLVAVQVEAASGRSLRVEPIDPAGRAPSSMAATDETTRLWCSAAPAAPMTAVSAAATAHAHPHRDDEHSHGHPSPLQRLRALVRLERDEIYVVLVFAIAIGLLSLVTPVAVQALVNSVAFGSLLQPLVVLSVLAMAGLTFAAVLRAVQARVIETLQQRLFVRVALDVAHRLPRARADALDHSHGPELANRFFDVITIQKTASAFLLDGLALV